MTPQRLIGVVLLVVGIALIIIGANASNSMADQVSETFTGKFTKSTTWYLVGGAAAGLTGLMMVLFGVKRP
jgi:hypothetical protein